MRTVFNYAWKEMGKPSWITVFLGVSAGLFYARHMYVPDTMTTWDNVCGIVALSFLALDYLAAGIKIFTGDSK